MKASFIRIAEVWLPNPDNTRLEFGGGLFGEAERFAAATRSLSFALGEGLPGLAWKEGRPILLKDFESLHFRRMVAANEAGLSCAVALPLFVGQALKAVLVLFGGSADARAGAVELWHNNPRVTTDMTLVDGYYGMASDSFEALSKDTFLPRGTGLPGLAWQGGGAVFMEDLGASPRFLRGATAAEAGITRGLGLPCPTKTDEVYVLTLLSALGTPIARQVESWGPNVMRQLERRFGFCETQGSLASPVEPIALASADNPLVSAFLTGVPALGDAMVAIPVVADGEVTEVLALYL